MWGNLFGSKDKHVEPTEDTPTEEEIQAFRDNIEVTVKNHLGIMLKDGRFDTVDYFLMQVPVSAKTPTYVLDMLLDTAYEYKDNLGCWTAFVNRVEDNAKMRDSYTEGQYDKYR